MIDRDTQSGVDASGTYFVSVEGDRYGRWFDICVNGATALKVWARRMERPPHAGDGDLESDVSAITAWVVDNRAGNGVPLLTLEEPVGACTLGEVLEAFLGAYETAFYRREGQETKPLKVECRGNQRSMMDDRYGA